MARELKNLRTKAKIFTRVFFEDVVRLFPAFWFENCPLPKAKDTFGYSNCRVPQGFSS
ncbi:DUF1661 domain-containing protein [Porphyromonas gulae]|uniref:DUF1661 domain-containing protein n=1 Tax=Porphyromonas gulae TaxID=111105 RepID=UPI001E3486A3|nr:DUF1661 domain-containing protein [Porphyromonas gulae]